MSEKPPSVHAGMVIDAVRAIAREHGYAIGVHGSLRTDRDIDLIAAPWVKWAHSPRTLMLAINRLPYLFRVKEHDRTNPMALGRMGYVWLIRPKHASCPRYVDLSVMPRLLLGRTRVLPPTAAPSRPTKQRHSRPFPRQP